MTVSVYALHVCLSVCLSVCLCTGTRCEKRRQSSSVWFRLCPVKSSLNCRNSGICVVTASGRQCVCDPPFIGRLCQHYLSSSSLASAVQGHQRRVGQRQRAHSRTPCIPNPCRNGGICHRHKLSAVAVVSRNVLH